MVLPQEAAEGQRHIVLVVFSWLKLGGDTDQVANMVSGTVVSDLWRFCG